jgi:hypothetical protein
MGNRSFLLFWLFWQYAFTNPGSTIEYIFPLPGSHHHPKETVIILRFKQISPYRITNRNTFISVNGKKQGKINGRTIISTDRRTIIFKPTQPFLAGEHVSVQIDPHVDNNQATALDTAFQFTITSQKNVRHHQKDHAPQTRVQEPFVPSLKKEPVNGDPIIMNGISIPSDFPWVDITVNDNPDTGYIFLTTGQGSPINYNIILDNSGAPIWYLKTPHRRQDFKVQPDGRITMLRDPDFYQRDYIAMDSTYTVVDTFIAPPGYYVDEHELLVLENGHYFLIAKNDSLVDMSKRISGGDPNATVRGNCVVEMDANDNPIFIWRSWDHFNILDTKYIDLSANLIDYAHMNAIAIDHDGHILISSRHLCEVTKINRQTGEIIWRLGGQNDYFEWINDDDRISWQHDIRVLPNGNYTVFDNGNFRTPEYSRALEFSVDTGSWIVTKEWEYRETPDFFASAWGNVQYLPNGNILIGWAWKTLPKVMEVRRDGSKAFQLDYIDHYPSYRAFRFPWKGKAKVPYLMIESASKYITLLINKFGDDNVDHYNIYSGITPHPTQVIAISTKPFIHLKNLVNEEENYFRVTAVNTAGEESGFSNEESIFVNIIDRGQNMLFNSDFSEGFDHWQWELTEGEANWEITDKEELHFEILESGTARNHIQVRQPNILLVQGRTYLLEFDAYAIQDRIIEAEVKKNVIPWTNYSKKGLTLITEEQTHYSYQFVMEEFTDPNARVEFNVGKSNIDVYLDNVSLKEVVSIVRAQGEDHINAFTLSDNYPNPFNPSTKISYTISNPDFVFLKIYDVLGREVQTLVEEFQGAGNYIVNFNGKNLSSGVYFYQLQVGNVDLETKKMLLMR